MGLPKYRLQTLFDMRERAKKDAEDQYAAEQKKLQDEQKKLQECHEEKQRRIQARLARRNELTQKMREGQMTVQTIQDEYRYLDKMAQDIKVMDDVIYRQQQAVINQEIEVDNAKQVVIEKSRDFKALEKHKEKWEKEVKRERQKKEEDKAEDIAQTIFMFNRNR